VVVANDLDGRVPGLRTSDGSILWQLLTGYDEVFAPQVVNRVLYVVSLKQDQDTGGLFAVHLPDGRVLWRYLMKKAAVSAPLVTGTAVYVSSVDGRVLALCSGDGSLLWQAKTQSLSLMRPQMAQGVLYVAGADENTISSLQVADGVMYTVDLEGRITALRGRDGSLLWQRALSGAGVASMPSSVQVVDSGDGSMSGLRASDGTIRWQVMTGQPDPAVKLPLVISV
jgi:outer membrane protein assembly factor BamB